MTSKAVPINNNDIFTSLISDIKSYSGPDPLLPWIRGVRKLRDSLPPQVLNEKLPRFLQKCAQTFESDRRYRNDLRYLRIWLQLMDYVDDPKALLRTMEMKKIGIKRSLFYQAYALYYEKIKKFEVADQMYRLGVQNLAEPLDELQKSYEQFIERMERHKKKRVQRQEKKSARVPLSDRSSSNPSSIFKENDENPPKVDEITVEASRRAPSAYVNTLTGGSQKLMPAKAKSIDQNKLYRDDSVVAEDACHHGLIEPTINTKEALNAINSMFREPIEPVNAINSMFREPIEPVNAISRSSRSQPKVDQSTSSVFEVFVDEDLDNKDRTYRQQDKENHNTQKSPKEPLQIFIDDESSNDSADGSPASSGVDAFVFVRPNDNQSESSGDKKVAKSSKKTRTLFREDTVVRRFVGSAILDDPEVENICHHGLVDPTVNLKEAMEDINGMFGKPIDFVRTTRRKRQEKAVASAKNDQGGFLILPDDEFNDQEVRQAPQKSSNKNNDDLYEPTVFTKQAMDDINNLFSMPLDF